MFVCRWVFEDCAGVEARLVCKSGCADKRRLFGRHTVEDIIERSGRGQKPFERFVGDAGFELAGEWLFEFEDWDQRGEIGITTALP